ncbi:hypothetical protein DEQ92_15115 [Haloferax sp. Atlit-6N]|uniref:DUF7096 domain-containing protein n=1 Tax=Haloferax gibbonsii (strain ATCC 33959 / DSM 4427 / JCM 8863 / NBRC 102184 / NCIMB 2188 / Ma 2.38) TaxID=1227459 RepID=M0H7Y8_HALGM|nr:MULTISPECIES: hypothetical protein [Haloferax]ELZ79224.1 hypothetical protein C454_13053 [Haloferax gibbonsii ATCC 33959]RDZ52910.1 hypothetical protein C5C07_14240 [Haloferax sp. Atlit-4N]REA02219.1 hypothetical protein DEQ92_15115 [Haloferax sp. Atlit-6N]
MSRRTAALAVVAAVLLATVGAPLALAAPAGPMGITATDGSAAAPVAQTTANDSATNDTAANDSAASSETLPGQRLSAVIGVQGSETDGELERRTFEARFANANSNASKAAVVATQVVTVRERLTELEQRRDRLEAQRENGTLSEGQYRARLTQTVADIERTRSMLNQTADAASTVPAEELSARGVETAELDRLRTNASELTGPEVAEIAREIAGNPGKGIGRDRAENESETGRNGRSDEAGRSDAPGNSRSEASGRADDVREDAGNATDATGVTDDASEGSSGDGDRGNAPETPPGNDKRAKDADGSAPAVTTDDGQSDDDGTTTTDDATADDESETSSTDDSGA